VCCLYFEFEFGTQYTIAALRGAPPPYRGQRRLTSRRIWERARTEGNLSGAVVYRGRPNGFKALDGKPADASPRAHLSYLVDVARERDSLLEPVCPHIATAGVGAPCRAGRNGM